MLKLYLLKSNWPLDATIQIILDERNNGLDKLALSPEILTRAPTGGGRISGPPEVFRR